MKKIILGIIFVTLLTSQGLNQTSQLATEIDKLIRYEDDIDLAQTNGWILGVVDGDSTYIVSKGFANLETKIAPDSLSVFGIGGVSQIFIIHSIYTLLDNNAIHLSDELQLYLPEYAGTKIGHLTLSSLLTHHTGLPKILTGTGHIKVDVDDPYKYFTDQIIHKELLNEPLTSEAGYFSHYNYYLLSKVLETFMDLNLYAPYGFDQRDLLAWLPDDIDFRTFGRTQFYSNSGRPVQYQYFGALNHQMGGMVNILTMLKVLKATLSRSQSPSFQELMLGKGQTNKHSIYEFSTGGFHLIKSRKSRSIYALTGSTNGSSCFFGFLPQTQTGVVILTNSGTSVHTFGMNVLRLINYNWKRKV